MTRLADAGYWILELDVYDYSLQHREGKRANADAMSRRPGPETHNKAVQCLISSTTSTDRDGHATSDVPEISHTLSIDSEKRQDQQSEDECSDFMASGRCSETTNRSPEILFPQAEKNLA